MDWYDRLENKWLEFPEDDEEEHIIETDIDEEEE